MQGELYIESFQVDIGTKQSSLLTMAIEDISQENFAARQTFFTRSMILPGTARNNKIFGHVFDVASSNPYSLGSANVGLNFNPMVSANCIYFQDFLQAFKGTVRLTDIIVDRNVIEYEVALTGELYRLNIKLSSGLLEDLNFTAYNQTYSTANIISSWDNPGGSGVYYPQIDYGKYSVDKHDWDIRTFRPAFYVKEYIDKMLTGAGFAYDAPLFDTARFEGLVVPHNQQQLSTVKEYNLNVGPSSVDFTEADGTNILVPLDLHVTVQDYTYNVDSTVYTYTGTGFTGVYKMDVFGKFRKDTVEPFEFLILINGTFAAGAYHFESFASDGFTTFEQHVTGPISLNTGDTLSIQIWLPSATDFELVISAGQMFFKIFTPGGTSVTLNPGDNVDMANNVIPRNIKQIDFFVSIIKLFNLYVYEDKFDTNLVHIRPYIDFYSSSSTNAIDWSDKLSRSDPMRITPLSEINAKTYIFTYKDDNDYYNETYKKRYNETYGAHSFDIDFEFVSQTQRIELIFAPTPLVGYAGEDKIYSTILKINNGVEDRVDSVIRILQTKKITGVTSWDILDGVTVLASTTSYGYAGHFNDPDTIDDDLNFGTTKEVFFIVAATDNITANQFNVYWSGYMAEITDKDSKLLTAKFYLKPLDVYNLDFSVYIYVDGVIFKLYKIADYNLTVPDLCEVQLLKVINTIY